MRTLMLQTLTAKPWGLLPAVLKALVDAAASGTPLPASVVRSGPASRTKAGSVRGNVAVIPVSGILHQKTDWMDMFFGGVSTEALSAAFARAVADDSVGAIVLDVDSPGGETFGIPEFAAEIFKARGTKPIVAVANGICASGAYWLASQAVVVVATPSSLVGSIGVYTMHEDISQMAADAGVKVTFVSAGKYKVEGNEFEPLTDEARSAMQHLVDGVYGQFVAAVASGRGVKAQAVRDGYGEGRVLLARDAVAAGLADRVATMRDVLTKLGAGDAPASMPVMHGEARRRVTATVTPPAGEEPIEHPAGCGCEGCEAIRDLIEEAAETPAEEQNEDQGGQQATAERGRRKRRVTATVTPPAGEEPIEHPAGCGCEGCEAIRDLIEEAAETPAEEQNEDQGGQQAAAERDRRFRMAAV